MHARELSLLSLTDSAADGDGSVLVISGDHDDSNAGLDAVLDGGCDFGPGWVQHADHPDKSDAAFVIEEFGGVFEIHVGFGHGIVDATEGQTTESVAAGTPRVRHFQDTGLDRRRHRHLKFTTETSLSSLVGAKVRQNCITVLCGFFYTRGEVKILPLQRKEQ